MMGAAWITCVLLEAEIGFVCITYRTGGFHCREELLGWCPGASNSSAWITRKAEHTRASSAVL